MRKREERKRKGHPHGGGAPAGRSKGVSNRGRIRGTESKRLLRKDAMRKYTINKAPGAPLQYCHREILQKDWNDRIEHGRMPTLREFARDHGLPVQTWKREYERGALGATVPDPKRPGRKTYALYDAGKAQDGINAGHANKGAPMKVTNRLDAAFARLVREMRLSPYDAVCRMREDGRFAGSEIPCVRTWYNHIRTGDISVHYGETPYHPDRRRRKGPRSHPAKTRNPLRRGPHTLPGKRIVKRQPVGWEGSSVTSPPCRRAMLRTMARPSPAPPVSVVRAESTR